MNDPERNLWRAVLGQAYEDAEVVLMIDEGVHIGPKAERARCYLRADSPVESADLAFVCGAAEVPADRLIAWARKRYPLAA